MSKHNFDRQVEELSRAIDLCFDQKLFLPGLMLIYAGIDAMAWLAKPNEADSVGKAFQAWVQSYLLKSYGGEVGTPEQLAIDLYGARCAVLHAQIAESDLSKAAKAREVHYRFADGTGLVPVEGMNAPLLNITIDPFLLKKWFFSAIDRFRSAIGGDPKLENRVYERADRYFSQGRFS